MVKTAIKEAMATGLEVSRTDLWNDEYGPDTKDQELRGGTGEPVLDAKQLSSLTGAEHGAGPGGFSFCPS